MINNINSERGSSLIIVLLMIVIFSLLGLTLLTGAINGAKQNTIRQNEVQATYQAQKGINYVLSDLNKVASSMNNTTYPNEIQLEASFNTKMNDFIHNYNNRSIAHTASTYGEAIVHISNDSPPTGLTRKLKIRSKGIAHHQTKEITTLISVKALKIPKQLKYALGAKHNLDLFGTIDIEGDLFVGTNLRTENRTLVNNIENPNPSPFWLYPSDFPTMRPENFLTVIGDTQRKTNGTMQSLNHDPTLAFKENYRPTLRTEIPTFNNINISAKKSDFLFAPDTVIPAMLCTFGGNYSTKKVFINPTFCPNLSINGSGNKFKRLEVSRDLLIGSMSDTTIDVGEGLIVNGDLIIGNPLALPNIPIDSYPDITIKGPIFVTGKLIIKGADLTVDSAIYVEDGGADATRIEVSRIQGLVEGGATKSLVLLSKGGISTKFLNEHEDTPMHLRAYLYSQDNIYIYGVQSHILIEGGIFSEKQVRMSAHRGKDKPKNLGLFCPSGFVDGGLSCFENGHESLPPEKSRLRVIYNQDIIENPPAEMPNITNIEVEIENVTY